MGKVPKLMFDVIEQTLHFLKPHLRLGIKLAFHLIQRKVNCRQQLPRFIVKSMCNALDLFFQSLIHPVERRVGVPDRAVGHLESRHAFGKKHPRPMDGVAVEFLRRAGM